MRHLLAGMLVVLAASASLRAQAPAAAGPPRSPRAEAPFDPTGYWVSLITDDWRYRMLTPPKGNVDYLPVTAEGRRVATEWDPARDEAAGEQCRAYGAVGVMRLPGRLHITWDNETTLRIDTDAGTQTRRFLFDNPTATATRNWQGSSSARWVLPVNRAPGARGAAGNGQGELHVTTTRMRPGYIRRNGVPYSGDAVLTEDFARLIDDDGTQYLAVTQMLQDAKYFVQPIVRTMLFRRQADASGWNPTPCSAR
jgi:hypothetical protein